MHFVLIGPDHLARARLAGLPNVHLLGVRDYAEVPAFLQHADVGLMPFNAASNPEGVDALQPQKMYAYLASGLPVVASDWENLRHLDAPVFRCTSVEEFIAALLRASARPGDKSLLRAYAARFNWAHQVRQLLQAMDQIDGVTPRQVA
jgi:glycosyltransferase involved in cell wall biosynthesis